MKAGTGKQIAAGLMAALMLAQPCMCSFAEEVKTSGREAEYDEAYYVMLDHYGNITDGSIVKSYSLNGQKEITDYGTYEAVNNLTDSRQAEIGGDGLHFRFEEENAPRHFYYEGKNREIFAELPWDITVRYKLNGVFTEAEELAGKSGTAEILVDLVPNEKASEYARYNYTLETAALFNQDDILSLEAEGAQIQLIGNIRTVLFVALPGEEQHLNIRVGTDDFSFGGLNFLMVPATLSQLKEVRKISENKEKLEDDYHKISDRVTRMLDRLDDMNADLNKTADSLDRLDRDTKNLAAATRPLGQDLENARRMLSRSMDVLDPMLKDVVSLKLDLRRLGDVIDYLQSDLGDADDKLDMLSTVRDSLQDTADSMKNLKNIRLQAEDIEGSVATAQQLNQLYQYQCAMGAIDPARVTYEAFVTGVLMQKGYGAAEAGEAAAKLAKLYRLSNDDPGSVASLGLLGDSIEQMSGQLAEQLSDSLGAPEELLLDLRSVLGNVRDYRQLIRDLNSAGTVTQQAVVIKGQMILEEVEAMEQILDAYRPEGRQLAEDLIKTAGAVSDTAYDTGEVLGELSGNLRKMTDSGDNQELREVREDISRIIEDTWDDYTGDVNNILLMDPEAEPVSLTDSRNPAPRSIQVIIRTAEIKEEKAAEEETEAPAGTGADTLGSRLSRMFSDMADSVSGFFARG